MKTLFAVAGLALALSSVAAVAQEGVQRFDWAAQTAAYSNDRPGPQGGQQCFNGQAIAGANRSSGETLYVQARQGGVYQMRLAGDCASLNAAQSISLRSGGSDTVCPGDRAELTALTAAGQRLCHVADVRRVSAREAASLSKASIR